MRSVYGVPGRFRSVAVQWWDHGLHFEDGFRVQVPATVEAPAAVEKRRHKRRSPLGLLSKDEGGAIGTDCRYPEHRTGCPIWRRVTQET
jgi:hypothetical protein